MTSSTKRSTSYNEKVVPGTISLKLAARLPEMPTRYSTAVTSIAAMEQQVQGILNGIDPALPTIRYPFYLNFGREVWKKRNQGFADGALVKAATDLSDKYVAYGCVLTTIQQIALDVFNITIPGGA